MHLGARSGDHVQRRQVWDRVRPGRCALSRLFAEGIAIEAPLGPALGWIDRQEPVAHRLVENSYHRCDRVFDRGRPVSRLPFVDGAVDHACRDLRHGQMPERGQYTELVASRGVVEKLAGSSSL